MKHNTFCALIKKMYKMTQRAKYLQPFLQFTEAVNANRWSMTLENYKNVSNLDYRLTTQY